MEKEFKPTELQKSAHEVFDQFVLNNKNGIITDLFGLVKRTIGTEVGVNAIKDELLNSGLLLNRQHAVYEYGSLGLELMPDNSGRYLGYLEKQHEKLWLEYQFKLKEQKLAETQSQANLSTIKTNETLEKSANTSKWVAILTSFVLIIQVGFQIYSESKKDQSLEQQNLILKSQQEQLITLKKQVENLHNSKIDSTTLKKR